jgi:hypothetical protein
MVNVTGRADDNRLWLLFLCPRAELLSIAQCGTRTSITYGHDGRMYYAVSPSWSSREASSRYTSFACENTHANMERTMSIYEDNIRQLLDSAYSGFGVIELMVGA